MRQSRTQRRRLDKRPLTSRERLILATLYRYRYLDTKHVFLLIGSGNENAKLSLRRLFDWGLIERLPNNRFGRDRLKDSQVYELTRDGKHEAPKVPQVTWLQAGNYKNPVHNLNLCLALASIEIGCARNGLRFIPWGELLDRAPKATRDMKTPYNFGVGVIPDALFSVEFPDFFACFAVELDLTHHGAKEYADKFNRYTDLIFKNVYKTHLGMKQHMYVLTITTSADRMKHMQEVTPQRSSPFKFRTFPEYGSHQRAPAPAPQLFVEGWRDADNLPVDLGALHGG